MPVFIMLTRLTPDGVKTLKDNPSRVNEVNKEVEQLGVKVLNQWATLGEYDFVSVVEAPDEVTMAKVSVELGSHRGDRGRGPPPDGRADAQPRHPVPRRAVRRTHGRGVRRQGARVQLSL